MPQRLPDKANRLLALLLAVAISLLFSAAWAQDSGDESGEATPPPEEETTPLPVDQPPPPAPVETPPADQPPALPGEETPPVSDDSSEVITVTEPAPTEAEPPAPPAETATPQAEEGGEVVVATPESAPKPFVRRASFQLAPTLYYPLAEETFDAFGYLYGGTLGFKYHPIPWLAVSLQSGYLMGYYKQDAALGYASYRRINTATATPLLAGVYAEILPRYRVNPFIGAIGGTIYLSYRMEPEDIDSPIPLKHDELTVNGHDWLAVYGGEVGLDVRITDWVGVFLVGRYQFASATEYRLEIPRASKETRLEMSHGGAAAGLIVYY